MRRRPTITTALYLTGAPGSAWRIRVAADDAIFEVQFADASSPLIVYRTSDVHADRHPRPLKGLDAVLGEPMRYTIGEHERYEAVVTAITRIRPFCARCGERQLLGACVRCLVDPTHHYAETKWVGKPMSRRRRMFYLLEPVFRLLDGR